jgi:hypothetical protein
MGALQLVRAADIFTPSVACVFLAREEKWKFLAARCFGNTVFCLLLLDCCLFIRAFVLLRYIPTF